MKAREFLRLAAEAREPVAYAELKKLADDYMSRAMEMETPPTAPVPIRSEIARD